MLDNEPVTNFINGTEALVDFAVGKFSLSNLWTTYKLPCMNSKDTLKMIPGLTLPAVTVTHASSEYGERPRRRAVIAVTVNTDYSDVSAEHSARTLADEVISLLDGQTLNDAIFRIKSYKSMEMDPFVCSHELEFVVDDH